MNTKLAYQEGREAVKRDLGLLDSFEKKMVADLRCPFESTATNRMFGYVLRLVRRAEASETTLRAIRRLSHWKQRLMMILAYNYLSPHDWGRFRKQSKPVFNKSVKITYIRWKLPFGDIRRVQKGVVREFMGTM